MTYLHETAGLSEVALKSEVYNARPTTEQRAMRLHTCPLHHRMYDARTVSAFTFALTSPSSAPRVQFR